MGGVVCHGLIVVLCPAGRMHHRWAVEGNQASDQREFPGDGRPPFTCAALLQSSWRFKTSTRKFHS
jgi:hypothetical protein